MLPSHGVTFAWDYWQSRAGIPPVAVEGPDSAKASEIRPLMRCEPGVASKAHKTIGGFVNTVLRMFMRLLDNLHKQPQNCRTLDKLLFHALHSRELIVQ